MEYTEIKFEVRDNGIATMTLNRPDKLNSFTRKMFEEWKDAFSSGWVQRTENRKALEKMRSPLDRHRVTESEPFHALRQKKPRTQWRG